jgi:DHA1 family multidrug resistance protein-like MFS transporter
MVNIQRRLRGALRIRGNLQLMALLSFLRGARDQMRGVVWQPFALSLGIPMRSLGGMESALDLTRITVQPILGGASDAYGRKRFLVLREILLLFALSLFIVAGSWQTLLLGALLVGLYAGVEPVWSSLVAESAEAGELSKAYSILNTSYVATGLFAPVAAGLLADAYGYDPVFYISAGLGLFILLLVQLRLADTKPRNEIGEIAWPRFARPLFDAFRPPPRLRGFYLSMTVDLFAFSLGHRLLYGMLTRSYGYTPYMLSLMSAAMTGVWAVSQIPLGRVLDRVGSRRFLVASQSISCCLLALLLVSKHFLLVLFTQVLLGVAAAMWLPAEQVWIARNVDPRERARAIGSYSTFRGLLAFPAPFIGGALFDAFGFNTPILINLVGAFIDVLLIATLIKDKVEDKVA